MIEFSYELDSIEKVKKLRDAMLDAPPDKFDIELCNELNAVLENPAKHNSMGNPRLMKWFKRRVGL